MQSLATQLQIQDQFAPLAAVQMGASQGQSQPAAQPQMTEYEARSARTKELMHQLVDQMAAIVDRPSAVAGVPKVLDTANRGKALAEKLARIERPAGSRSMTHSSAVNWRPMPIFN